MSIIKDNPEFIELTKKIRENSKDFVIIIGAGLSKPAGLPDWIGLKNLVIEDAKKRGDSIIDADDKDIYLKSLDKIASIPNSELWQCFTSLKNILKETVFNHIVQNHLTVDKNKIPLTYELIWQLKPLGIVDFNLDSCAIESYSKVNHSAVDFATHMDTSRYKQFILGSYDFLLHPHGYIKDPSTWVLTEEQKTDLLMKQEYRAFMETLLRAKHVVIFGFNPDDFAFSYLLQDALFDCYGTGAKHYIFLSDPQSHLVQRLTQKDIGVISYSPSNDNHPEIEMYLKAILGHKLLDIIPSSAFTGQQMGKNELPPDEELESRNVEDIRNNMNSVISTIIPSDREPTKDDYDQLSEFYREYAGSINKAWHIEPNTRCDRFRDYRAIKEIGQGFFGRVFEAINESTGDRYAIKVLLPHVKSDQKYLLCFRRGVRAMRILTKNNIQGMVKFIDAYEVPACIIMDYIEGINLNEAMKHQVLNDLNICMKTLVQIGEIVHKAHNLTETVFHRDLKPSNVILKDYYTNGGKIDVVVVDFDLSWYKGALDTYIGGVRDKGYAAPEQKASGARSTNTRNALVDVFGYGMLAYFLLVGGDPRDNEHMLDNFKEDTVKRIRGRFQLSWEYLPLYLADIIYKCTRDKQSERIPFLSAVDAFNTVYETLATGKLKSHSPIVLGEIAKRLSANDNLNVTEFDRKVAIESVDTSKTASIILYNDHHGNNMIKFRMQKVRSSFEHRNVASRINGVRDKAKSILYRNEFANINIQPGTSRIDIFADWLLDEYVSLQMIKDKSVPIGEIWQSMSF